MVLYEEHAVLDIGATVIYKGMSVSSNELLVAIIPCEKVNLGICDFKRTNFYFTFDSNFNILFLS